jgi:hypothetical protein
MTRCRCRSRMKMLLRNTELIIVFFLLSGVRISLVSVCNWLRIRGSTNRRCHSFHQAPIPIRYLICILFSEIAGDIAVTYSKSPLFCYFVLTSRRPS